VGRFLSRPLWAGTSLLAGDPEGFARNIGQFALDVPTGGFVNPSWSLANLFSETGDITESSAVSFSTRSLTSHSVVAVSRRVR
jgi:hypothetical protein